MDRFTRDLEYYGTVMDFTAVEGGDPGRGSTPLEVAAVLACEDPALVTLEPGDATRYRLRLEPSELVDSRLLIVSRMDAWGLPPVPYWAVTLRDWSKSRIVSPTEFLGLEGNEWSRILIAHYLTLVAAELP